MRALTFQQARRCEQALRPGCRCRCGGALHGAKRVAADCPPQSYEELPREDPHHVVSDEERLQAKEARRLEDARQKLEDWLGRPVALDDVRAMLRARPPQE